MVKEMTGYTPLMLAVASGDHNLDCVKLLLTHKADYKKVDFKNNTVLHIAALNGNNTILEYLVKNLEIDVFARNKDGETALTICEKTKNSKGIELFSDMKSYDNTEKQAQALMQELEAEDEQTEEQKAKKKQKKWRNKINKLAK
jgi:ankyrin repeat protein